ALLMRALDKSRAWEKGQIILEVDCLNRLGRSAEAKRTLELAITRQGELEDYCLAYANTLCVAEAGSDERLAWINRIFAQHGFAELDLIDREAPLAIDNLCARDHDTLPRKEGPKVSVLMPAYNSAA